MTLVNLDLTIRSPFILLTDHRRGKPTKRSIKHHRRRWHNADSQEYVRYWTLNDSLGVDHLLDVEKDIQTLVEVNDQARIQQCLPWISHSTVLLWCGGLDRRGMITMIIDRLTADVGYHLAQGESSESNRCFFDGWDIVLNGACQAGNIDLVRWILSQAHPIGRTGKIFAARYGHPELSRFLLLHAIVSDDGRLCLRDGRRSEAYR